MMAGPSWLDMAVYEEQKQDQTRWAVSVGPYIPGKFHLFIRVGMALDLLPPLIWRIIALREVSGELDAAILCS